ncbi:MAG TPA: SRPBCC family protein [Baekduia sp.]|jgi:uncharacterized protein YndB with AHSA1/START domain
MSVIHADFAIERRYGCSPPQTFSAFADPALKRQWFAVPADWAETDWTLDFRVGGGETNRGRSPDGKLHAFVSRFHDIVAERRIVFAYDLLVDDQLVSVSLTTVEVFADGDGSRLLFTEQGAFFDEDPGAPAEREHGTGVILDRLGPLLAGEPAR